MVAEMISTGKGLTFPVIDSTFILANQTIAAMNKYFIPFLLSIVLLTVPDHALCQIPGFTRTDTGDMTESQGGHSGIGWLDMDNDGDLDLILNNYGAFYRNKPNLVYRNERNGDFVQTLEGDYPNKVMFSADPGPYGDVDNDGDIDILLSGFNDPKYRVYKNNGYSRKPYHL